MAQQQPVCVWCLPPRPLPTTSLPPLPDSPRASLIHVLLLRLCAPLIAVWFIGAHGWWFLWCVISRLRYGIINECTDLTFAWILSSFYVSFYVIMMENFKVSERISQWWMGKRCSPYMLCLAEEAGILHIIMYIVEVYGSMDVVSMQNSFHDNNNLWLYIQARTGWFKCLNVFSS